MGFKHDARKSNMKSKVFYTSEDGKVYINQILNIDKHGYRTYKTIASSQNDNLKKL